MRKHSIEQRFSTFGDSWTIIELKINVLSSKVVSMNSRWQQYNGQREKYVQQLLQRVAELEQAMVNKGQMLPIAQQESIDRVLLQQKQKVEMAEDARKLVSNNTILRLMLSTERFLC